MTEHRDEGLKRALGPWALGANIFNTVVGAGIFVLPAALYREIGGAAPLAYIACMVMMGGVVMCFAAAGSRVPTSGGPYGFVQAAFGPLTGFLVGMLLWVSNVLAAAGLAAGVADTLGTALPVLASPILHAATIIAILGALAAVNALGAGAGARLVGIATVLKLLPLAVLLLVGAPHVNLSSVAVAHGAVGAGFGRAMLLAIFAFQGMETALGVSGEVRDPARNVPLGLIGAMVAISILYIAIQFVVQGVLGAALATSAAPLADAARAIYTPLGVLLLVGTVVSMLGFLAGDALSTPRVLFAFGRDGFFPKALGRLNPKTGAPVVAILAHEAVAVVLALTGGFVELVTLSALATVGVYIVACGAAVVLQRRGAAYAGPPLQVPGLWIAAAIGIGGMIWLILNARPAEIVGMVLTLLGSAAIYWIARRSRAAKA